MLVFRSCCRRSPVLLKTRELRAFVGGAEEILSGANLSYKSQPRTGTIGFYPLELSADEAHDDAWN